MMKENLVWDIYAFVPSKAGLTKEVVRLSRGWSLLQKRYNCIYTVYVEPQNTGH